MSSTPPFDPRHTGPAPTAPLPGGESTPPPPVMETPLAFLPGEPTAREPYRPPLDLQIRPFIAQGYRVTYRDDWTAQLVKGGQTSHLLHLILTLVTAGLWGVVWIILAILNREKTVTVTA